MGRAQFIITVNACMLALLIAVTCGNSLALNREGVDEIMLMEPPIFVKELKARQDGLLWEKELKVEGVRYLRVHISQLNATRQNFRIVISDKGGTAVQVLQPSPSEHLKELYSQVFFADTLILKVLGPPDASSGLSFTIDHIQHGPKGLAKTESIVGKFNTLSHLSQDRRVNRDFINRVTQLARSIVKIYVPKARGAQCTGFLIHDTLVLTNEHCIQLSVDFRESSSRKVPNCADVTLRFDYFEDDNGPITSTQCKGVLDYDRDLDFALLEIDPLKTTGSVTSPRPFLYLSTQKAEKQEVIALHYPSKNHPLVVSWACDVLAGETAEFVLHDCATQQGSSGAALINSSNNVVALHHTGAFDPKEECEGSFKGKLNQFNEGTKAATIMTRIQSLLDAKGH